MADLCDALGMALVFCPLSWYGQRVFHGSQGPGTSAGEQHAARVGHHHTGESGVR